MATTSAGDSTAHSSAASRCGAAQIEHSSSSVSMRQRRQRVTEASAPSSACASDARRRPSLLQEMEGHALGRLRPDAGEGSQRLDELREAGGVLQNGSFMPGGSCRPAVMLDIFSCTFASTL